MRNDIKICSGYEFRSRPGVAVREILKYLLSPTIENKNNGCLHRPINIKDIILTISIGGDNVGNKDVLINNGIDEHRLTFQGSANVRNNDLIYARIRRMKISCQHVWRDREPIFKNFIRQGISYR